MITEDMATKYFGSEDPVGKTLVFNNTHSLAVTGVVRNVPANSTISFDMLVPFEFLRSLGDQHRPLGVQLHHHLGRAQRSRRGRRRRREDHQAS